MGTSFSFGNVNMNLLAASGPAEGKPSKNEPFHILLLGDLSGRRSRGLCETATIAKRPCIELDRDNVDEVIARLKVELRLPVGSSGQTMSISFQTLDDFHPDHLYERLEVFSQLRQTRRRLSNNATFAAAAAELQDWAETKPAPSAAAPQTFTGNENLLDLVVGETESSSGSAPSSGATDWSAVIREIVGPHVAAAPSAKQAELIAKVDDATSDQMRALLASPAFKQLEATWKGLDFLVRRLETGERLKIFVADVTKEELVSDLRASEELGESGTYHLIVDRTIGTPGSKLWSALAGVYEFEDSVEDIEVLGRMARIAALAGAPFLAGGTAHLAGVEKIHETPDPDDWDRPLSGDVEAAWKALRKLPEARYLAVALPRFLTRLPYGKKSNPAERFQFEEMPDGSEHESYCWACSSILCAAALARGFEELGWNLRPAGAVDLDGLPMHVYKEDGESVVKPCAEVLLVDRAADRITDAGLVPIQSFKGGDTVRVRGITAVASPTVPVAGRWSH